MNEGTVRRILMAVVVAVVVGVLVYLLGLAINEFTTADSIGSFIMAVAGLAGILAGITNYVSGRNPTV